MNFTQRLSLCIFLTAFSVSIYSQNERPKIGLVLSGGGAKGIAHIGVLKAMEEAGLTPDFITGTSMGSIVGGLYSIGYSADELKEIVLGADWDLLLTNKIPLDKVTYEEKYYYGKYLLDFYLKGNELQLPEGVIEGQALMDLFSNLTRPVHNINDFNDFPIPFACVGANIVTAEPVVLNHGSLALSMRASMAIPTVFTPVKIGNDLMVDGGLLRNMPVDEVLEMGADMVIGVFVGTDLTPEEDLKSAVDILTQSAFITAVHDARVQLAKCDILIQPNLEGYTTSSFHSAAGILERGNKAGEAFYEVFKHLADSLKKIGPLHTVVKPEVPDEYIFDDILVEGNEVIEDDFVIGKMRIKPGEPVSMDYIEYRIGLIYGTQYFEKLWYEILGEPGHQKLKIYVVERPKTHFRFSYHYDTENKGGIVANATFRNLLLNKSRLIFEADLGTHPTLLADYFKYMGKKQDYAIGASGLYLNREYPLYDSTGTENNIFTGNYWAGGLKLQSTRLQSSTFGLEVVWSSMDLKSVILENDILRYVGLKKIQYSSTSFTAFYHFNNTNERYYPTRGLGASIEFSITPKVNGSIETDSLSIEGDQFLETSSIFSLDMKLNPIIHINEKISVLTKARLRMSSIGNTLNLDEYDFIGGFIPGIVNSNEYIGVRVKEFQAINYFFGKLGVQYEIKRNLFVQALFNYLDAEYPMTWIYPDAVTAPFGDRYRRFSYGATIGYKSVIGPIILGIGKDHYRKGLKAALGIGFFY